MSIGSIDQNVLYLLRILLKRCCQAEIIFSGKGIQDCSGKASLICAGLPSCNHNGTIQDTQRFIRDHQVNIKFHFIPKSQTIRAGTKRIIERKASRFNLIHTDTAVRAGKALAEIVDISVHSIYHQKSLCQIQNCLNGI